MFTYAKSAMQSIIMRVAEAAKVVALAAVRGTDGGPNIFEQKII